VLSAVIDRLALLTDLYELTMGQAYLVAQLHDRAVFELFVRRLPPTRSFLVAAGLADAVAFLQALRFSDEAIGHIERLGPWRPELLAWLRAFRFSGDVDAMPEGTIFFEDEPILRVEAPIAEAQLVETQLLNVLHFQTVIASKAARVVLAAPGRLLVDFGLRRAHGADAGLGSARASYLAGFGGTSNVLAATELGIPAFGSMAHSFVLAHDDEAAAFVAFARATPMPTLLIDTYDTEAAARRVVDLAPRLAASGCCIHAVRLDSGDLGAHARSVRAILDAGGLTNVQIFASGSLDEHTVDRLERAGAPIDGYGVGTKMNTSADAPYLDCAYKLEEYAGCARRKRSEGKATWPGRKQVYRRYAEAGTFAGDTVALVGERQQGDPLLVPVMRQGRLASPLPSLHEARARCRQQMGRLPQSLRGLGERTAYPVTISAPLRALAAELDGARR
jgi:nicotinate phosphoribosyltransferase